MRYINVTLPGKNQWTKDFESEDLIFSVESPPLKIKKRPLLSNIMDTMASWQCPRNWVQLAKWGSCVTRSDLDWKFYLTVVLEFPQVFKRR